ncbi:MAG: ABC transporter substrate-binding protein [Gammaproteobacteria bacterium]|nr:ABC transporter substrate-binding protein [Gammaproteobacteria bacterium]
MKLKIIFICFILITEHAYSKVTESLTFAAYLPQSPPYFYVDESSNQLIGIAAEVLRRYSKKHNLRFKYELSNRLRAEKALYDGSADVSLLSSEWVKYPEQLIFSEPFYSNGDKFYALSPLPDSPGNIKNLKGKVICTREFYKYPLFDQYVANDLVKRMDTQSEIRQFKMMLSGRCDLAYMNEWVATHIINKELNKKDVIYGSENSFDINHGVFAFSQKWQPELANFNQYLINLKASGELDEIINQYVN